MIDAEGEYAGEAAGETLRGERLEFAGRIGKDNDSRLRVWVRGLDEGTGADERERERRFDASELDREWARWRGAWGRFSGAVVPQDEFRVSILSVNRCIEAISSIASVCSGAVDYR